MYVEHSSMSATYNKNWLFHQIHSLYTNDPNVYVREEVIYNKNPKMGNINARIPTATLKPPSRSHRARIRPLHLIEEQVNLPLHAQHVRGLALFDLLI